ncbi:LytR/AlgR family response regulator transcription factor [Winogradskyella tangerina]|uniref:LytR/AlgR family response regulator transcription factor n=1 Tax=Winogradskyella tangerina TaxID=2023240 RepID=UPI000DBE59D0|nr:LytTR family DNA-binding domain-containing protein [Winogradskyella tangerina]
MKVVIVEDEIAAAENLIYILDNIDAEIEVLKTIDSVKSAVTYFSESPDADLIFMDIHLADGISFQIFDQVEIKTPIIFTTAYDQYAIQAFQVNSINYLLKPLQKEEISNAIDKYKETQGTTAQSQPNLNALMQLLDTSIANYKATYLVQKRDELIPIKTDNIAYFSIDSGVVKATTIDNQKYVINKKLEDIEAELDPKLFMRVNRQFILNKSAIVKIKFYFNGKLIIITQPPHKDRIVVSKGKSNAVKSWINS